MYDGSGYTGKDCNGKNIMRPASPLSSQYTPPFSPLYSSDHNPSHYILLLFSHYTFPITILPVMRRGVYWEERILERSILGKGFTRMHAYI